MENKECCTPGPPAKEHNTVGKEEECCGLGIYFNWPTGSTKAIVLVSDVFGWKTPRLSVVFRTDHMVGTDVISLHDWDLLLFHPIMSVAKVTHSSQWSNGKIADKFAAAGFVAVVPDFFRNDPVDSGKYNTGNGVNFNEWKANHPVQGIAEDTLAIIKELKNKGIKSVGQTGFCYGAKVGVLVASEGALDATVFCHPSLVVVDDLKAMKGPLAILGAEHDRTTPVSLVEQYKKYLESQDKVEHFIKIFPGVAHGWTVRFDDNDENAVKSADEAHADAISWFEKYLK